MKKSKNNVLNLSKKVVSNLSLNNLKGGGNNTNRTNCQSDSKCACE